MRILAITNQKGGVGKTTTCVNLAASLAATKRRVLLIDLDPQGNATTGSGVEKSGLKHTIYHVLIGDKSIAEVRVAADSGFDVVPANRELAGAEVELVNELARETRLKAALSALDGDFEQLYPPWLGRPSIPPERLLRAMLLQAIYGIRSERQLMERIEFDLLFRWFVGLVSMRRYGIIRASRPTGSDCFGRDRGEVPTCRSGATEGEAADLQ